MAVPAMPLQALLATLTSLRFHFAAEPEAANSLLGSKVQAALSAHPLLAPLLGRYGWQKDSGFTTQLDLCGLHHALQKYKYEKLSELGSGTYAVVHKARNRETLETIAIKKLRYSLDAEGFPDSTIREIVCLRELKHENIVQLKDIISTVNASHVYLVLECMDCDLRKYLDECPEAQTTYRIKSVMYQILKAMHHAHTNLIMHRDLKPQNILVDRSTGRIKVADFGLARQYLPPFKAYTEKMVTLYYRAPELLLGAPHYSPAIDMWSIGCILAELVNFRPLFQADTEIALLLCMFQTLGTPVASEWQDMPQLQHYNVDFPKWQPRGLHNVVPNLASDPLGLDLLSGLLQYDPKRRITPRAALEHPWFTDVQLP